METSESTISFEGKQRQEYFIAGLVETIRTQKIVQKDLAAKAHISAVTLSKVLNGRQRCSLEWRNKICLALGMSDAELISKGEVIAMVTTPSIQNASSLLKKPYHNVSPEQGQISPSPTISIDAAIQIIRDRFQDSDTEINKIKTHLACCYEVLEAIHDSVTIVSSDRKICYQNNASLVFWGKHHEENVDTILAGFIPGYVPNHSPLQKTFDLNTQQTIQVSTHSGISTIIMLPVASGMGRVDRVIIIARQATDTHQDLYAQARTQAAMNALNFSLIIFDQNRNLVQKNRAFCNMLNLNGQEINTFDDLQTVASRMDNAGEIITRMYKIFDQKFPIAGKCVHPDGMILWQELTPLFGNDGEFLGVACQLRPWNGEEEQKNGAKS